MKGQLEVSSKPQVTPTDLEVNKYKIINHIFSPVYKFPNSTLTHDSRVNFFLCSEESFMLQYIIHFQFYLPNKVALLTVFNLSGPLNASSYSV